jgi:cephalosporin hydroxylase
MTETLRKFSLEKVKELEKKDIVTFQDKLYIEVVEDFKKHFGDKQNWENLDPFFFDNIEDKLYIKAGLYLLLSYRYKHNTDRFVPYVMRLGLPSNKEEMPNKYDYLASQGFTECMTWKGKPIYKTISDMAIYNMLLWELKPKTIIEIGSGNGSSAEYFRDIMKTYDIETHIISLDINNKFKQDNNITYLNVDCNDLDTFKPHEHLFKNAHHPMLIIEDAHTNIEKVLDYFYSYTEDGDYIFVEDISGFKGRPFHQWVYNKDVEVDTKYTDYFGINYCSAKDGILKRVKK